MSSTTSPLQFDLFMGICGKSDQDSAEGGLLIGLPFFEIEYNSHLVYEEVIHRRQDAGIQCDNLLKKLKMPCVGGNWRLNEITKSRKELFKQPEIELP